MKGERGIVRAWRGLKLMTVCKGGDEIRKVWNFFVSQREVSAHHRGSRIEDRMVVENALDLKEKVPSAPTPGHRGSRP